MGQVDTSGLSNLKSWVGALSRFGDSHGFYWATVAIAKTAHSKVKLVGWVKQTAVGIGIHLR